MRMDRISGSITGKGRISGTIGKAETKPLPYYEGEYVITPKWKDITLNTKQKSMKDDMKVTEIPYLETENPQGGVTVVIGGL